MILAWKGANRDVEMFINDIALYDLNDLMCGDNDLMILSPIETAM